MRDFCDVNVVLFGLFIGAAIRVGRLTFGFWEAGVIRTAGGFATKADGGTAAIADRDLEAISTSAILISTTHGCDLLMPRLGTTTTSVVPA
jgi:hypothetical protein